MSREELDDLLEVMPKIAEAVNSFEAADLQRDAFSALLRAYGITAAPSGETADTSIENSANGETQIDIKQAVGQITEQDEKKPRAARKATRRQWSAEKNVDFWPSGKISFQDLCKEKQPNTIDQKNLIVVYWFEQISDLGTVDVGKVLAAYKSMSWLEPSQPDTRLRNTASKFHWIDTSDMGSIKTTPGGRNMVSQMPIEKAKKK